MITNSFASSWTTEQVSRWLQEIGLGEHSQIFLENAISGNVLLLLTAGDLDELGVKKLGHRRTIETALETLKRIRPERNAVADNSMRTATDKMIADRFRALHLGQMQQTMSVHGESCLLCGKIPGSEAPLVCLTNCSHMFCSSCLKKHLDQRVADNYYVIHCALCSQGIHRKDTEMLLSEQQMNKIDQLELQAALGSDSEFRRCPTQGCGHVFQWEEPSSNAMYPSETLFRCDGCCQHYCLKCKCPFHHGLTCVGYRKRLLAKHGSTWTRFDNSGNDDFFGRVGSDNMVKCHRCCRFVERSHEQNDLDSSPSRPMCSRCGYILE